MKLFFGCSQWGYESWRGSIYPEDSHAQDYLRYYSRLFNSVELNSTFYNGADPSSLLRWKNKTGDDFRFCPKIPREISHEKHFKRVEEEFDSYVKGIRVLENKLGITFLQLSNHFNSKDLDLLDSFLHSASTQIRISVEPRLHILQNDTLLSEVMKILIGSGTGVVITDSAETRQYLSKLKLTSHAAFVRFISYGHETDYQRLDEWFLQISKWDMKKLPETYFFLHSPAEETDTALVNYFVTKSNDFMNIRDQNMPED